MQRRKEKIEGILEAYFDIYVKYDKEAPPVKIPEKVEPSPVPPFGKLLKELLSSTYLPDFCMAVHFDRYALEDLFENAYVLSPEEAQRIAEYFPDKKDLLLQSYRETVFLPVIIGPPVRGKRRKKPDKDYEEDRRIIEKVLEGEIEEMNELIEKYGGLVKNIIWKILEEDERIFLEDLYQDTWVKVVKKLPTHYDFTRSFKYWLSTIARNVAIDFIRKERKRKEKIKEKEETPFLEPHIADELDYCLSLLPEEERSLIEMVFYWGFNQKEIARKLGVSPATVSARLKKIYKKLEKCMEG